MRKRSPGPVIQPASQAGTNGASNKEELRAEFVATPQPSVPVIRYSETLDWRAREATDSLAPRPDPGIINVGGTRLSQQEKPLPPPTSTNLYNSSCLPIEDTTWPSTCSLCMSSQRPEALIMLHRQ